MKRLFDFSMSLVCILVLSLPMLLIAIVIKLSSYGPVLYWSNRVGRYNHLFKMPKFRTMKMDTPELATHLLADPDCFLTSTGKFLRKTSLDELPQLLSILKGDMSFVGPRPALFNQDDLIKIRTHHGVHILTPGITGWAQVNGRDKLPIPVKVEYDTYYLNNRSLLLDFRIIYKTILKIFQGEGIHH